MLKASWFTEQLALAAKETSTWPEWARREAGLDVAVKLTDTQPTGDDGHEITNVVSDQASPAPVSTK